MIKEITSKDNNKLKYAASLKMSKFRKENKEFLAEGKKSLELALQAGVVKEIFTTKKLLGIKNDITQYLVNDSLLKKISSSQNPEGIVFVCNMQERNQESSLSYQYQPQECSCNFENFFTIFTKVKNTKLNKQTKFSPIFSKQFYHVKHTKN